MSVLIRNNNFEIPPLLGLAVALKLQMCLILLIISVKGHMKDKTLGIPNLAKKKSGVPLLGFSQSFNKLFSSGSEGFPDHTHNQ